MIVTALGAVLIGLGTRRWFPSWLSGVACLAVSAVAGWVEGVLWLPAVTVLFLALSGIAVQKGLLARRDAYALVWLVSASGTLGVGALLWSSLLIVLSSVIVLRRRTMSLIKRQATELVITGASIRAGVSPTLAPAQERATIVVWPLVVAAALLCYLVGGLSIQGVTGGEWWTTSSLVF